MCTPISLGRLDGIWGKDSCHCITKVVASFVPVPA